VGEWAGADHTYVPSDSTQQKESNIERGNASIQAHVVLNTYNGVGAYDVTTATVIVVSRLQSTRGGLSLRGEESTD
jgi:hypothetical protein